MRRSQLAHILRSRAVQPRKASGRLKVATDEIKALKRRLRPSKSDRLMRMLDQHGLGPFEAEWPFAKEISRRWRFDIAWPAYRVAVEIEGGIFGKGRADGGEPCQLCGEMPKGAHGSGTGILRDIEKYNAGLMLGWRIYRVPTNAINWETVRTIARLLEMSGRGRKRPGRAESRPRMTP